MSRLLRKVCGLVRSADVNLARRLGADFLGFVFHPGSPRCVSPYFVAQVVSGRGAKVGVFVSHDIQAIAAHVVSAGLDLVQLHGDQDETVCEAMGPHRVIRVFWPERYARPVDFERDLRRFRDLAAFYLFDAGSTGGGHGRPFDPAILAQVDCPRPWLLAGGLGPDNVCALARAARPAGVDFNSGLEAAPGIKDPEKLRRAFGALAQAQDSEECS